ncbi:AI-2E family transporter [Pontibacter sp. MBLB2868]|uniref:AI-2E family transporter n=1 Tax=Pontibacter sp. MBLB2868 TaxID=3451555 RepID=UPI003F750546
MNRTFTNNPQTNNSTAKKAWTWGAILAFIFVVLLLFKTLFSIILLTFAGLLIAVYFVAFGGMLRKILPLPKSWSVFVSVFINLVLLVAFFWFVGDRLTQQISQLSETLPQTVEQARARLGESSIGQKIIDQLSETASSEKTSAIARSFFSSAYGVVSDLYIVLLIALFLAASPSLYRRGVVHLLPPKAKDKGVDILDKLYEVLKKWLIGQIIGVFFIGILTAVGLIVVDLPLVLTLSLIAGLMNFIPNFGPIIALIPAVLLAFMQGTSTVLIVIAFYTGIQVLQTALMTPLVQKKMVDIPPLLIIVSQIAMGTLGGFWGVLLAMPTVAVLMTLINELYVKEQSYHKYEFQEK